MKYPALTLGLLLLLPAEAAANVRLESLDAFDVTTHRISVTVQGEVSGGCLPDTTGIQAAYESLLEKTGFRLAAFTESDLEFAVSIKGFVTSGTQKCGLKVLTMARQIPLRKILRISPGSHSERYRLWVEENLVTGEKSKLQSLLQEQAVRDVFNFRQALQRARAPLKP